MGTIQTIRRLYNTIGKLYENESESRWANEGGRLKPYENQTNPYEHYTKTTPKADIPTRRTIKTIRILYKTMGKLYENDPKSRWANEEDD